MQTSDSSVLFFRFSNGAADTVGQKKILLLKIWSNVLRECDILIFHKLHLLHKIAVVLLL